MPPAIRLGPLVFPAELAVLAAAALVGLLAAHLLNRTGRDGRRADVSGVLWGALIVGLLAARLGFVWQYRDPFVQNPLAVLDVRDGGWAGTWGLAAAWIYAVAAMLRRRAPRPAVIGALALATVTWLAGGRLLAPPDQSPPALAQLRLQDLSGAPVALSAYQGKPTVVNLWASWCPPCRREMPAFEAAQAAYPDVHFVFLNQGEAPPEITHYLRQHAPALQNVLMDPASDASRQLSNRGLPATLFLDASGRMVDLRVGELSAATLAQRLDALRAASSKP
ncbi:TlpA family protein disulfide reductase [Achromobacter mucicolens]|uniref:TlpA family protein disulfide reductase n=1 Tax=Achromobacter mucicolens TaxID=1389922 RepID=UPI0022F4055F|nr:TlpA disulfide reductase family protein [Achromobacter mucicolens]WBX91053.1 TlpA disulfide reductase family protein [Achromobacter mucicolens]